MLRAEEMRLNQRCSCLGKEKDLVGYKDVMRANMYNSRSSSICRRFGICE